MDLIRKLKHYRISQDEYKKIQSLLKREPKGIEFALFSALWSEHCSYKSSRVHLKNLYRENKTVLQSFGENAGIIDLGEGEKIAFKMESHNHPSYIEPFQGAATGVGGILRDIFTMGARPIASANYLCFGDIQAPRMQELVDGVVRGIGGYGNCVGVPTITGQTEFHRSYNKNILVNAMSVGYFGPKDVICISRAKGVGNLVVYVGAKTGKDGVHGASMASESFSEDSSHKKPNVQIGDPFFEKLLIESCIEVMNKELVVAIQDMGAAGLTSSSFEMAAKGKVGMEIHLDQVPLRDSTVGPEEILLSESQERMLLICEPKKFEELKGVFTHWGLEASPIGKVISEQVMRLYWHNEILTEIDPDLLVDNCPAYKREFSEWKAKNRLSELKILVAEEKENEKTFKKIVGSIEGCSRSWIYGQYDQRVGARTERDANHSVSVLRLDHSNRGLAIAVGCRPYVMRFDAYVGGIDAVAYPALEMAAKGFTTLAVTDCLNFGNPEKNEIMSEFVASLKGMNSFCEAIDAPIISGNVSFYNETEGENITSTPSTGLVGLRSDKQSLPQDSFQNKAERVYLVRLPQIYFEGAVNNNAKGLGEFNISKLAYFIKSIEKMGADGDVISSRVVGKFGLAYALFRMASLNIGVEIKSDVMAQLLSEPRGLFSEVFYEVLFSVKAACDFLNRYRDNQYHIVELGSTIAEKLILGDKLVVSTSELNQIYNSGWEANFEGLA
ncbi:MAG: phosphoribosylformylglycinamidine synthase subunit PurL [Pseudomonadota bacterium]|nr:phosphoribosylformylglycinamidine synthase subunit PurL [Pseudomonadota bacterium]